MALTLEQVLQLAGIHQGGGMDAPPRRDMLYRYGEDDRGGGPFDAPIGYGPNHPFAPEVAPTTDINIRRKRVPYLDRLGALLSNMPSPGTVPTFGSVSDINGANFVSSALRGFGQARVYGMSERAQLENALRQEAHDRNVKNAEATRDLRKRELDIADYRKKRQIDKEYDSPKAGEKVFTDAEAAVLPWLKPAVGLPRESWIVSALKPPEPSSPAEQRAIAALELANRAADRADQAQKNTAMSGAIDDYRQDKRITGYQQVRSNLKTAEAAYKQQSGPGDIAIVFSYMRALEPENPNAVREGEYTNARKATGLFQTALNLPNKYFKGNQLSEEGRLYFLNTMRAMLKARRPAFDEGNKQFEGRADYGQYPANLVVSPFAEDTVSTARPATPGYRPKSWKPVK